MKTQLTIHGKGGHSKVVSDAFYGERIFTDEAEGTTPHPDSPSIIAVGDNEVRRRLKGNTSIAHFTAVVAKTATIGKGVFLAARATVGPSSRIGDGVIINTGAIVEHDCVVGEYSHIASSAVLCGNVTVGSGVFVGANSVVKEGLSIGDNAIIGCGAAVVKDVPGGETWVGVPAKPMRHIPEGD